MLPPKLYLPFLLALICTIATILITPIYNPAYASEPPTSEAKNAELVGHVGGVTNAVAVQGDYAYLGVGPRLLILDTSNSSQPVVVGQTKVLPDAIENIEVQGNYVYVAAHQGGLYIFDVSLPDTPIEVNHYTSAGSVTNLTLQGNLLYLATVTAGLQILDISDPANITVLGAYGESAYVADIVIQNEQAYALIAGDLQIIDVSNPSIPTQVGIYYRAWQNATSIAIYKGRYIYVATQFHGMRVLDVANPMFPGEVGWYKDGWYFMHEILISGDIAYVVQEYFGLCLVDISSPANPVELSCQDTPNRAVDAAIGENKAFIADRRGGLRIADISNPIAPAEISFYETPWEAFKLVVDNGVAYIANDEHGFALVDVTTPTNPEIITVYQLTGVTYGIAVQGDYAYLVRSKVKNNDELLGVGLSILNITDPKMPIENTFYKVPSKNGIFAIVVKNKFAYLPDGSDGLRIIDMSNPNNPNEVGLYDTPEYAFMVKIEGNLAYVTDNHGGLIIIDILDPTTPQKIGDYTAAQTVINVEISGATAFAEVIVGDNIPAIHVLDITDPTKPQQLSTDFPAGKIVVQDKIAYVASNGSIRFFDASNPVTPVELGYHSSNINVSDIFVKNEYVYVTDSDNGLYILRFNPSISGRVSYANGLPLSDVPISAAPALTTTSHIDGGYIFTDLPDDSYTLTLTLPNGLTSHPTQRTISPPFPAPGQNFVILPKPVTTTLTPGITTTLTSTDTHNLPTTLTFPVNAVSQPTTIIITPTVASPENVYSVFTGHAFEVAAYQNNQRIPGFEFKTPVEVSISYSEQDVRDIAEPGKIDLLFQTGSEWIKATETCAAPVKSRIDFDENEFSATICQTGLFGLFGPRFQTTYFPVIYRGSQ